MKKKYKYNRAPPRLHPHRYLVVIGVSVLILGSAYGAIVYATKKDTPPVVVGKVAIVPQAVTQTPKLDVNEPLFTMQLPINWKETGSVDTAIMHSISWGDITGGIPDRYMTIYIDTIPKSLPVIYELPLAVHNNQLAYGEMSGNCSGFTPGGTLNTYEAETLMPAPSTWDGINFMCNLPEVILNQVGTGAIGEPVNTVTITGPTGGTHNYFFFYADMNPNPNYSILTDAIQSFRAK